MRENEKWISQLRLVIAGAGTVAFAAGQATAGELVYGVTQNQTLINFDSQTPGVINGGVAIFGLQSNEQVRGIDFRPATGQLYALGSFSNLYTINLATGGATLVGAGSFTPTLNGSSFGFDFNPVIDRIRVVSEADQNLVLHPDLGTATGVTSLFYPAGDPNAGADPNVVGSAYTNSFAGAASTQLYGIDTGLDILVTQANSAGTLGTVGSLGADLGDVLSFDISGASGIGYAGSQDAGAGVSMFWTINLSTGAATAVGAIGGGALVTSIAVVPAPSAVSALLALSLAAGHSRRRRHCTG